MHKLQLNMTRKNAAAAYFNGELQNELREKGLIEKTSFTTENSREEIMKQVDAMRKRELYHHTADDCSALCKQRGMINI